MASVEFDTRWQTANLGKERMAAIKAGDAEDPKAPLFREIAELRKALQDFASPLPLSRLEAYEADVRKAELSADEIAEKAEGVRSSKVEVRQLLAKILSGRDSDKPSAADLDAVADENAVQESTAS